MAVDHDAIPRVEQLLANAVKKCTSADNEVSVHHHIYGLRGRFEGLGLVACVWGEQPDCDREELSRLLNAREGGLGILDCSFEGQSCSVHLVTLLRPNSNV